MSKGKRREKTNTIFFHNGKSIDNAKLKKLGSNTNKGKFRRNQLKVEKDSYFLVTDLVDPFDSKP